MTGVPAGSFWMGSRGGYGDETPRHEVTIRSPFSIGKFEISFAQYDTFALATGRKLPDDEGRGRGDLPVVNVSWEDAQAYIDWLSVQTGESYRFPTEAEWEYAARAGSESEFWWGPSLEEGRANCEGCGSKWSNESAAPVGEFEPNPFRLHNTAGNVWEWVEDCWTENYVGASTDGSVNDVAGCRRRVIRGGSWDFHATSIRSAEREWFDPKQGYDNIGFRVARDS